MDVLASFLDAFVAAWEASRQLRRTSNPFLPERARFGG